LAENAKVITRQQQQQHPLDKKGVGDSSGGDLSIGAATTTATSQTEE
jgi:hypothetical protein